MSTKRDIEIRKKSINFAYFVAKEHNTKDYKEQSAQKHDKSHKPVKDFRVAKESIYSE